MSAENTTGLVFGIYPGMTGEETPVRVPWNPERVCEALDGLQAPGRQLVLRAYLQYSGSGQAGAHTPSDMTHYMRPGRGIDLVLQHRCPAEDLAGWLDFIRTAIARWGGQLACLQIGEEPNSAQQDGDGGYPGAREAVVSGVIAAKEEIARLGLTIQVGCNSTPIMNPADDYWRALGALGGDTFRQALDYIALDFFPDVFFPIPLEGLAGAVGFVVGGMRAQYGAAGIPLSTPMHIAENAWPTGSGRPPERQAEVLETIVRALYALRGQQNLTQYEYFGLRDPDSSEATAETKTRWGLLYDDYTPKPAYAVYRRLIEELGA